MSARTTGYPFAIAGKRPVLEALSSPKAYAFQCLCIAYGREKDKEVKLLLKLANRKSIPLEKMDAKQMDRYAPGCFHHQGLVLLLKKPPQYTPLEDLMKTASLREFYRILALDELTDHQNVGAMVRSAAAFGFDAVFAQENRSAPLIHPTIWRTSQGAAEHIEFSTAVNLAQSLKKMKENGFWIVGAVKPTEGQNVRSFQEWPKKLCLVLGSENKGLRRLTREHCDMKVAIPMAKTAIESLNVAHAAAILLWEISTNRFNGPHSSMDRVLPSEGKDGGSIPPGDK